MNALGPAARHDPVGTEPSARRPVLSTGSLLSRPWLIVFAVLAVAFVVSAVVLIMVASPPSYEPVPVPTVDRV